MGAPRWILSLVSDAAVVAILSQRGGGVTLAMVKLQNDGII